MVPTSEGARAKSLGPLPWRQSHKSLAIVLVLPFVLQATFALLVASDLDAYQPDFLPIYTAANIAAGFVFMARSLGYVSLAIGFIYVPVLAWLLPRFGQFVVRAVTGN